LEIISALAFISETSFFTRFVSSAAAGCTWVWHGTIRWQTYMMLTMDKHSL